MGQSNAKRIQLDNANILYSSKNLYEMAEELRRNIVLDQQATTTSLNGTLTLEAITGKSFHYVTGTATGFTIKLPDATTLFLTAKYEIMNKSEESIDIVDNGGNLIESLPAGTVGFFALLEQPNANGVWDGWFVYLDNLASGIVNYNVTEQNDFIQSGGTYTLITGMSVMPIAGLFAVWFNSDVTVVKNNDSLFISIFKDNAQVIDSERTVQGVGSKFNGIASTMAIVSVDGTQIVNVRQKTSSGNGEQHGRSLILIRLGPQPEL